MKKLMKRIGAVLMAIAMMAALGVSAWAEGDAAPAKSNPNANTTKTTLTISDVKEGSTVKVFRIYDAEYADAQGKTFTKFSPVTGVTAFADESEPQAAEIVAAANAVKGGTALVTKEIVAADNETFTWNAATAGAYIAIITAGANDDTLYNPILLVASWQQDSSLAMQGTVSTEDNYLYPAGASAKSSTPTVEKVAEAKTDDSVADDDKMDVESVETAGVGDTVTYTVTPSVPDYPPNSSNKTFFIADKLSDGLTFEFDSLTVAVDGMTITKDTSTDGVILFKSGTTLVATALKGTENNFNLNFEYDALDGNAPTVTYTAVINSEAVVGVEGNPNTVELYYTNDSTNGNSYTPDTGDDKPSGSGYSKKEKTQTVYTYELAFEKEDPNTHEKLSGAQFGIYTDEDCENLIDIVTTNDNGIAVSNQVAQGTYYVKEITAPSGYSLNTQVYTITAEWTSATTTVENEETSTTYTADSEERINETQVGWLKGTGDNAVFYSMSKYASEEEATADDAVPAYLASEETTTSTLTTTEENYGAGVTKLESAIPNSKTSELPSTGGIGTYVFTVAGVAIMAIAAGLLIVRHKKKAE